MVSTSTAKTVITPSSESDGVILMNDDTRQDVQISGPVCFRASSSSETRVSS